MAIRLPITTTLGHTSRAISFKNLENVYFGIGKPSAWSAEETNPDFKIPLPQPDADGIEELIGMKRVDVKSLVVPDEEGTIVYRDRTWRKISEEEAIQLKAHWVYLEASIKFEELPATQYRQIGLFSRVEINPEFQQDKSILLPNEIKSSGILEILDYRRATSRNEDSKDTFSMIIEF